jgi:micrococcal nuclease
MTRKQTHKILVAAVFILITVLYGFLDEQKPSEKIDPSEGTLPAINDEGEYLVERVVDGDTIRLATGDSVRYIGIDTPETVHPSKGVECFGKEASQRNKELVDGRYVRLEADVEDLDRYDRILRYVYVDDVFVNLKLVHDGYAYVSTVPPNVKYQVDFLEAARAARGQSRGLWSVCSDEAELTE